MIIDGHAHACGIYLEAESILENLKKEGIDKVILSAGEHGSKTTYSLPALGRVFKTSKLIYINNQLTNYIIKKSNVLEYLQEENIRLAQMAQLHKEHILNTYWVNMLEDDCLVKLKQFEAEWSFALIKLHQCWTPFDVQDMRCSALFSYAGKIHKPIFIHMSTQEQVRKFIKITHEYPDTIFIVAHLIGIEEFNKNNTGENIYFDISCPELNSMNMLKRAYDLVGAEHIILGSDTPYGKHNISKAIKKLEKLELTKEQKECICGKNMAKLLNLS